MNKTFYYLYYIYDGDFNILAATRHYDSAFAMTLYSVKINFFQRFYDTHELLMSDLENLNNLTLVYRAKPKNSHELISDITGLDLFFSYRKHIKKYLDLHNTLCNSIEIKANLFPIDSKLRTYFSDDIQKSIMDSNPETNQYSQGVIIYSKMNNLDNIEAYNELKMYLDSIYITRMSLLSCYVYLRDLINQSEHENLDQVYSEIERVLFQI